MLSISSLRLVSPTLWQFKGLLSLEQKASLKMYGFGHLCASPAFLRYENIQILWRSLPLFRQKKRDQRKKTFLTSIRQSEIGKEGDCLKVGVKEKSWRKSYSPTLRFSLMIAKVASFPFPLALRSTFQTGLPITYGPREKGGLALSFIPFWNTTTSRSWRIVQTSSKCGRI